MATTHSNASANTSLRVDVRYKVPSAHTSNPLWEGARGSSLASPPPETSSSQADRTLRPADLVQLGFDDLPRSEGLELWSEPDNSRAPKAPVKAQVVEAPAAPERESVRKKLRSRVEKNASQASSKTGSASASAEGTSKKRARMPSGEDDEAGEQEEEYEFVDSEPEKGWLSHLPEEEQLALIQEMYDVEDAVPELEKTYRLVDRLGEGTFSSVYKALDLRNSSFDNKLWLPSSANELVLHEGKQKRKHIYVAIKRIYVTSSPTRIENEISILEDLRGCSNISQVITAFRHEDQILVVMPFHCNDDFRNYYKHLPSSLLRSYFRELFRALRSCHARGIIHRDVKPANFLFDEKDGSGILVDFGLAQRYNPPSSSKPRCQHSPATYDNPHGVKVRNGSSKAVEQAVYEARKRQKLAADRVGFPSEDRRPQVKANRAGTRGFRAPEVLLKCPDQTVAIDIWSAGIILLSILSRKFPIFNSNDDTEALMEISAIFGKGKMEKAATTHNRTFLSNIPAIDHSGTSLTDLISVTNPDYATPLYPDTQSEHNETLELALDFLKHALSLDSTKRITASQAMRHPFLARPGMDEDKDGPRRPGKGKCGALHTLSADGTHIVKVNGETHEVGYGEGVAFGDNDCPIHAKRGG